MSISKEEYRLRLMALTELVNDSFKCTDIINILVDLTKLQREYIESLEHCCTTQNEEAPRIHSVVQETNARVCEDEIEWSLKTKLNELEKTLQNKEQGEIK